MKKFVGLILGLGVMSSCIAAYADGTTQYYYDGQWHNYNEDPVHIQVNGQAAEGDMPALILNSSTLVPARVVFEKLGAQVIWDGDKAQVNVQMDDKNIILYINDTKALVNGDSREMIMPAKVINDRTMIPVRFVAESLGMKVEWNENDRIVNIKRQDANIINMQADKVGQNLRVTLTSDSQIGDFSTFRIDENPRVVVDVMDAVLKYNNGDLTVDNGFINKVRAGQNSMSPNVTRIVMDMKEWTEYNISVSSDKKEMYIDFDCGPADISSVKLSKENGHDIIDVDIGADRNPAFYSVGDSQRIFMDIPMSAFKGVEKKLKTSGNFVKSIETVQMDENNARLAIDVSSPCTAQLKKRENGVSLILDSPESKNIEYSFDGKPLIKILSQRSGINYFNYRYRNEDGKYVITLPSSVTGADMSKLFINDGYINDISIVPGNSGSTVDLVFETKQSLAFNVDSVSSRDNILITAVPEGSKSEDSPVASRGVSQKIVVIDPGHGGDEVGAIYKNQWGEITLQEKDLNLDISLKLYELLKSAGVQVYLTRTEDKNMDVYERANFANDLNASLFISVHNNAGNSYENGTMTLFYPSTYDKSYGITGERAAQITEEELLKTLGTTNLGVWKRPRLAVLNGTKMPAILAEIAYITNDGDRKRLEDESFKSSAAQALYVSAVKILNEMELADKTQKPSGGTKTVAIPKTPDNLKARDINGFTIPSKYDAKCDYQGGDINKPSMFDLTISLDYAKEVNKKYTLEEQRKEAEQVLLSKLDPDTVKKIMDVVSWQKDFSTHIWEDEIEGSGYTIWVRSLKNTGICTIDLIKK